MCDMLTDFTFKDAYFRHLFNDARVWQLRLYSVRFAFKDAKYRMTRILWWQQIFCVHVVYFHKLPFKSCYMQGARDS